MRLLDDVRWLPKQTGLALLAAMVMVGCAEETEPQSELATEQQALTAYCNANVVGVGMVPTETEYLANVVHCENGGADLEALKAQAVAARSYLYYKMSTTGQVDDGTSDQVFSCGSPAQAIHYQAVEETSGEYLEYNNTIVAAFYVAGAIPGDRQTCVPVQGDSDPTNTEHFVTYNQGLSGDNIEQTSLGWVNTGNYANRGCKSQNGAHCLAEAGWNYRDIIRFYYGDDIEILTAEGPCVDGTTEPPTCGTTIESQTVIDDLDSCFSNSCRLGDSWREEMTGYDGHVWWTYAWDQPVDCTGEWSLEFAQAGEYDVEVYVTDLGNMTVQAPYTVRHAGQESDVVISQDTGDGWVSLGQYEFASGADQWIRLVDETGEPYVGDTGPRIMFDAVRLTRIGEMPPMDDGPIDMGADMSTMDMDMGTTPTPDASLPDANVADTAGLDVDNGVIAQRNQTATGCGCTVVATPSQPSRTGVWLALLAMVALFSVGRLRRVHAPD